VADTCLFTGALFTVNEFTCAPADEAWATLNHIRSRSPIVVFPRHAVVVRRSQGGRVLATPNLVMLYNPGDEYERELRDERGDHALYFELRDAAVEAFETTSTVLSGGRLTATHVPSSRLAYLRQYLLARYLRSHAVDPLVVEEAASAIVGQVLTQRPARADSRRATVAAHHELAERAKERIVETISEALGLAELARGLGTSPFHLARVFRASTGFTLHQYRKQMRLRLSLDRLAHEPLSHLAHALGFASHSHFTDAFNREFGVAPSAVRDGRALHLLTVSPIRCAGPEKWPSG
jgi:AraC family transcriptional regulator